MTSGNQLRSIFKTLLKAKSRFEMLNGRVNLRSRNARRPLLYRSVAAGHGHVFNVLIDINNRKVQDTMSA